MIDYYRGDIPPEIQTAIQKQHRRWGHYFPSWVRCISYRYNPSTDSGTVLSINCQYKYRTITIWIFKDFLERTEEQRTTDFVHEIAHAIQWEADQAVDDMLEYVASQNKDLANQFKTVYRRAVETYTEDLAVAITQGEGRAYEDVIKQGMSQYNDA